VNCIDPGGLVDRGGTWAAGIVINNSGRPVIVVDSDNRIAEVLEPGHSTDKKVDWDYVVDGATVTKVGPHEITITPDGRAHNTGWVPGKPRRANPEEEADALGIL
jgi:DNA-binding beta-propeller fold protein YncE